MKCPKCGHVRTAADPAPDYECPACGIVYAKYDPAAEERRRALAARRSAAPESHLTPDPAPAPAPTAPKPARLAACDDCGGTVSVDAEICPHCGARYRPAMTAQVRIADIDMAFWSMVVFMVKWAIATIPAVFILIGAIMLAAILFGGVGSALAALLSAFTGP